MNLFTPKGLALPSFCDSRTPALPLALDAPASASRGRCLHRCGHRRASTPDLKPQVYANPRRVTAGAQRARNDGAVTLLLLRQVQGPGAGGRVCSGPGGPELLGFLTVSLILPPGLLGPPFRDNEAPLCLPHRSLGPLPGTAL